MKEKTVNCPICGWSIEEKILGKDYTCTYPGHRLRGGANKACVTSASSKPPKRARETLPPRSIFLQGMLIGGLIGWDIGMLCAILLGYDV